MTCLAVTAGLTGIFLGHLDGLGIGTILAAFTMGKVVGIIGERLDNRFQFVSVMAGKVDRERGLRNLSNGSTIVPETENREEGT